MKNYLCFLNRVILPGLVMLVAGACTSPSGIKPAEEEAVHNAPRTYTVEISQMKFSPAELTVKKGDSILFLNHDIVDHDVTEESRLWTTSRLQPQKGYTLELKESANYYCSLHPVMKGIITVQ